MKYKKLALLSLLLLSACAKPEAVSTSAPAADTVTIGVVYPVEQNDSNTYFREGIELAVEQINETGGILGQPLEIHLRDDENNETTAARIAQSYVDDNITAVVGHWNSTINYMVEDIYEENEVVLMMPCATSTSVFDYDYKYIFRMCSNTQDYAKELAASIAENGYRHVAICYSDDIYGNDFAEQLERFLNLENITVIDRMSNLTAANVLKTSERWKAFGCDAVIIGNLIPEVFNTIGLIRSMDTLYPIYGADNFQRTDFAANLDDNTEQIYRIENDLDTMDPVFLDTYQTRYGHLPDIFAVSAYESLFLLRDAMEACGSTDATMVANYLHTLTDYPAVSGTLTYNPDTFEFEGRRTRAAAISGE